jgi:hypothetical protein
MVDSCGLLLEIDAMPVAIPGDQRSQVIHRHRNPLAAGVAYTVTLMDDDTNQGVIVARFDVSLAGPFRQCETCGVFAFGNDSLAVDTEAADIAAVFGAGLGAAVDAVVL